LLAIETSCDETAVAVLEAEGTDTESDGVDEGARSSAACFTVLGNALLSQIDIHKEYGGVYPMIAKREHAKNLVPLLGSALEQAGMHASAPAGETPHISDDLRDELTQILEREPGLSDALLSYLSTTNRPEFDAIAVTAGPGLEPALWVGVNFARALARAWGVPIVSVNHMEGHICAALAEISADATESRLLEIPEIELPLLSLLISGGHTELVLSKEWGSYELVGSTRDDAVGEAFDKVARMLGLPYPGGPEVSKLAERARESGRENIITLPRPMIHDPHCDFSFSGLKTAVLYQTKDKELSDIEKEDMARAFEDAAADVLYAKTARALEETNAQTLALGGGVSANTHIKRVFRERLAQDFPHVRLAIPAPVLTTDNALMIGLAGFYHAQKKDFTDPADLRADGNRALRT
jgi:N6-L-threonylcarbamoyladenine synthase